MSCSLVAVISAGEPVGEGLDPDGRLYLTIHHRPNASGTIGEARASNFLGAGLRLRF
jgi:hypothetical protein